LIFVFVYFKVGPNLKYSAIKLNYFINGHYHKVIKLLHKNPVTSTNETLIKIYIEPSNFLHDIQDPLNTTNNKWFINLSNSYICTQITNFVQLGDRFSLPINY